MQSLTHPSVNYNQIRQSERQMVVHVVVQHNESAWSDLILKGSHPRTDQTNETIKESFRVFSHMRLHPISHRRPCNAIAELQFAVPFGGMYTMQA